MKRSLVYVEIDLLLCVNTYGVPPCMAEIGVTGDIKCFNTLKTCQDRANFNPISRTVRFCIDADYRPKEIEAFPSIRDWSITPPKLSLGEDLGQRGGLTVSFRDHPTSDTQFPVGDPYPADRDYNPFDQGTFWGKFRGRHPFLSTRRIRLIRGFLPESFSTFYPQGSALPGNALLEQETRHYLIESFDGPRPDATYSLIAKDVLKLAEGKRGQAPRVSNGFLAANISDEAGSASLSPVGIGSEYLSSGYLAIGGKEIVAFTRSGDTLTLTARGQFGTEAVAHTAQDRVQSVVRYAGADPADIIGELLVVFAGVSINFIPVSSWHDETSAISTAYTGVVAEPTAVETLVSEIIRDAGLVVWWDDVSRLIRLQALRPIPPDSQVLDESVIVEDSFRIKEQPEKRLSQVWTAFAKRNPLEGQEDANNYRSTSAVIDLEKETDYNGQAIRKIFSRWISTGGRAIATRLGEAILSRFKDPPRLFSFDVFRGTEILLGGGYLLDFWPLQDETGARVRVPIQVTRVEPKDEGLSVEAEEMLFVAPSDTNEHLIIFDSSQANVNLRTVHDLLYGNAANIDTGESPQIYVRAVIESNTIISSNSTSSPAFNVGDWPSGIPIFLDVRGRIQGAGGNGGKGGKWNSSAGDDGTPGGPALYTREAISLNATGGAIWGGGGGGGGGGRNTSDTNKRYGGGGGGGAGISNGQGGGASGDADEGRPGSATSGGAGGDGTTGAFDGGNGGNPGQSGDGGSGIGSGNGGAAGAAIDGSSFVTVTASGDIRGPQTN